MTSKKLVNANWKTTDNRFIAFFDILGFKDLVSTASHAQILKKLSALKFGLNILDGENGFKHLKKKLNEISIDQTKSVTFSDSIIVFSKGSSYIDASKILYDSNSSS